MESKGWKIEKTKRIKYKVAGKVVGEGVLYYWKSGDIRMVSIGFVEVFKEYRGNGYGTKIFKNALEIIKEDAERGKVHYTEIVAAHPATEKIMENLREKYQIALAGFTSFTHLPLFIIAWEDPLHGKIIKVPEGTAELAERIVNKMGIEREIEEKGVNYLLGVDPYSAITGTKDDLLYAKRWGKWSGDLYEKLYQKQIVERERKKYLREYRKFAEELIKVGTSADNRKAGT